MSVIRFEGVEHSYGERSVLAGVDLTLSEHRIGVIGANGGGKSTLARMINGLVMPSTGQVTVDGLDTRKKGRDVRRKVGFVFTDPNHQIIMPTVAEDIEFSLRRRKMSKNERAVLVDEALDRFGLSGHREHPTHLLSGGQKQLLALAAVMVTDPDVLVADEPTTLLDLRNTRMIAETFARLPQQLIVVTHQLDLLNTFDRVLVIDEGRVVADGAPQSSIDHYRTLVG
ncbi:MAG: ABC transporter ATP-binding protein [Rhodococcus sp.]|nr:ABC transporter ATP-binding protein [Rhodococcus sp. (in: high G+C Gram-positive bacteria)]